MRSPKIVVVVSDRCLGCEGCDSEADRRYRCLGMWGVRSLFGDVGGAIAKIDFIYKLPNNSN